MLGHCPSSQWSKNFVYYIEAYGTTVKFSQDIYCAQIGFFNNKIKFYNCSMDADTSTFSISVENANATIIKLFKDKEFIVVLSPLNSGTSTFTLTCNKGKPNDIRGAFTTWEYANSTTTITTIGSGNKQLLIHWTGGSWPPAPYLCSLKITVKLLNGTLLPNVPITAEDESGNRYHQITSDMAQASFFLLSGTYNVTVTYNNRTYSGTILVYHDIETTFMVGSEPTTHLMPPAKPPINWLLITFIILIALGVIGYSATKKD